MRAKAETAEADAPFIRTRCDVLFIDTVGIPATLTSPYWLLKGIRERKYLANFRQRLALLARDTPDPRPLWRGLVERSRRQS
jgi:hypothetical protein